MAMLRYTGTSLKLGTCELFTNSVKYFGHVIRPGQLLIDEARLHSSNEAKHSTTQTELRSFLELSNVYRRFISGFIRIAGPLNKVLKKGQPTKLDPLLPAQTKALDSLKALVTSAPIYRYTEKIYITQWTRNLVLTKLVVGCFKQHPMGNESQFDVGHEHSTLTNGIFLCQRRNLLP